ncbi:hypothetical protein EW146_g5314 [Bondarzewia mesenterica]|uniref:Uncharacterized protein n=1 Tax=Bondarzewia mesenterica TaxID=1095465 RepID=A0A4S4LRZ0_9AGAM|nr:hypothetical protein EW146_g5314 [Bondarzewia mesenterica]
MSSQSTADTNNSNANEHVQTSIATSTVASYSLETESISFLSAPDLQELDGLSRVMSDGEWQAQLLEETENISVATTLQQLETAEGLAQSVEIRVDDLMERMDQILLLLSQQVSEENGAANDVKEDAYNQAEETKNNLNEDTAGG